MNIFTLSEPTAAYEGESQAARPVLEPMVETEIRRAAAASVEENRVECPTIGHVQETAVGRARKEPATDNIAGRAMLKHCNGK